jgi:hypothetical protein
MQVLEGLAYRFREDPVKLSAVLAAFARADFSLLNWDMGMEYGGGSMDPVAQTEMHARFETGDKSTRWPLQRCMEVARAAMRGRRRSVLTARADGMLWALEVVAVEVVENRLHHAQVERHVIECRELSPEERITNEPEDVIDAA